MSTTATISDSLALRLALAAKAVPEVGTKALINLLISQCGDPLSEKKFRSLSPKQLRQMFAEAGQAVERSQVNQLYAILSSAEVAAMEAPSIPPQVDLGGPVLRLAVSSNNQQQVDGHFGSCLRFLIFEVSAQGYQLCAVREVEEQLHGDARTDYLLSLISDCQLLATLSIGGPAAAKLTRADILPLKQLLPQESEPVLERLQTVMRSDLPRWLAKLLGVSASCEGEHECRCETHQ